MDMMLLEGLQFRRERGAPIPATVKFATTSSPEHTSAPHQAPYC
jgi:hypothetical protein